MGWVLEVRRGKGVPHHYPDVSLDKLQSILPPLTGLTDIDNGRMEGSGNLIEALKEQIHQKSSGFMESRCIEFILCGPLTQQISFCSIKALYRRSRGSLKKGQQLSSVNHDFHHNTIHFTAIWSKAVEIFYSGTKWQTNEWTNAVPLFHIKTPSKNINHWAAEQLSA